MEFQIDTGSSITSICSFAHFFDDYLFKEVEVCISGIFRTGR